MNETKNTILGFMSLFSSVCCFVAVSVALFYIVTITLGFGLIGVFAIAMAIWVIDPLNIRDLIKKRKANLSDVKDEN